MLAVAWIAIAASGASAAAPETLASGSSVAPDVEAAHQYSLEHEVGPDVAQRRLELMDQFDHVIGSILPIPHVAGVWLEHEDFAFVIAVDDESAKEDVIRSEPRLNDFPVRFVVRELSEEELRAGMRTVAAILEDDPEIAGRFGIGVRLSEGSLIVETSVPDIAQDRINRTPHGLPDEAIRVEAGSAPVPAANIYAGVSLSTCTAGFSATRFGVRGILTAGHCGNTQSYQGSQLPYVTGVDSGNYDVQFHKDDPHYSQPWGLDATFDTTTPYYRKLTWVPATGHLYEGRSVCKYGKETGYDCGTIIDASYYCTGGTAFRRVDGYYDMADQGDSGGPVYLGSSGAAGLISCEQSDKMVFMPATFVSSAISASILLD